MRNVLFVFENGRVQTPPFEDADPGAAGLPASAQAPASRILRGCTIRRAVQIARELLAAGGGLGVEGAATALRINEVVVVEKIFHPAVWEAHGGLREMVLFSGDIGVDAVVEWDGRIVGDGKPGPVARAISERIFDEARGWCTRRSSSSAGRRTTSPEGRFLPSGTVGRNTVWRGGCAEKMLVRDAEVQFWVGM